MSEYKEGDKVVVRHPSKPILETVEITGTTRINGVFHYLSGKRQIRFDEVRGRALEPVMVSLEQPSVSSTGGAKNVKPEKFSLIPTQALAKVAEHYGVGAEKYAAHQWRQGYEWSKSYDALQRHATAFWSGEDNDPETKTPHMAAVVFHALTLLTFMDEHPNHDDRYKEQI